MKSIVFLSTALLPLCGSAIGGWTQPQPLTEVNTFPAEEWSPFLSFDGLTLYFARVRSNDFYYGRIFQATRQQPSGPFIQISEIPGQINEGPGHALCPWVSPDNLRMYYHREYGGIFYLQVSERPYPESLWPQGRDIFELNSLGSQLQAPKLTPDESTIVFDAYQLGGGLGGYDIWIATRPDKYQPFGQVQNLAEINSPANESAPYISPDGLELYFTSDRNGYQQLFRATRDSLDAPFDYAEPLSCIDTPDAHNSQCSLSGDGTVLYLMRQTGADRYTRDIYVSYPIEPPHIRAYHVDVTNGDDLNDGLSPTTPFETIQKAIDTAGDHDNILVHPGIYTQGINFRGKALTVSSAADAAILQNPNGIAVSFVHGEGPSSILKNFVVRHSPTAILMVRSSPTLTNLTIVENEYGIEAYALSEPDISNSIFRNNSAADLLGCDARHSWVQDDTQPQPPIGLLSHWKLDEGIGTTTYDCVSDNYGTIHGADWTTGWIGAALDFHGPGDGVFLDSTAGKKSTLNIYNADLTLAAWVKFRTGGTIIARAKPWYITYRLGVTDNKAYINTYTNGPGHWILYTDQTLKQNTWYHLVGVFNRTQDRGHLYVNGIEEVGADMPIDPRSNDSTTNIGCRNGLDDQPFDGIIDDVMLFDRALSNEEIQMLHQNGLMAHGFRAGPLFADPDAGDYHLLSERGRYWPQHDVWVLDKVSSPCIDAGDPAADYSKEPAPNGRRINLGAYGGTAYASMSEWPLKWDLNYDGLVNIDDLIILIEQWLQAVDWAGHH